MHKKVTIKDVAMSVGASVGTISKVLNGGRCAPDLQARVETAIRDLNYVPNLHARAVRATRNNCIGIMVDNRWDKRCPCLQTWLVGLLRSFSSSRYAGNIYFIDPVAPELGPRHLPQNVDGLVLLGKFSPQFFTLLEDFLTVPAITYWEPMGYSRGICLQVDLHSGLQQLAEHLFALGHRRIGVISDASELGRSKNAVLAQALKALLPDYDCDLMRATPLAGSAYDFGYDETMHLLADHPECTAIVYMTDSMAMGGLGALAQKQLRIPQDISVVGFDNSMWASSIRPPLTSVGFNYDVLTAEMINYLSAVIEDRQDTISMLVKTPQPLEFFRRQSTGCSRI